MSNFLSYFANSTNKQSQKQQNGQLPFCQQSQVTYEEIDTIDEISENQNSGKQNNIQSNHKTMEQKSASSGDFEEMKQNDESPLKNRKETLNVQLPSQDLVQINVQDSYSYDDINQSISESHQVKKKQKLQVKQQKKTFFDIEEESPSCENLMDSAKIAIQYPNMSESFGKSYQIKNFSQDLLFKPQSSKVKNNQIDYQSVNQCLNLLKIGNNVQQENAKDKLIQSEEKSQNSFFKKQKVLNAQKPETQCSFNAIQDQNQQQDDLIDVNKSTFTEKIPTFTFKNNQNKISPGKQINTNQSQKQKDVQINVAQSCYMQNVSQKPKKVPSIKNEDKKQHQPQKQVPYTIYEKDSLFFVKYGSTPDRRLNDKIFQSISQTFLMNNIMLPFFSLKLLEDHEGQIEIGVKKQKEELFSYYTNIYFEFLHQRYQKITKQFFEKENEKSQQKSKVFDNQIGLKKDESGQILGIFYKRLIEYFKMSHYSKAKLLKESLQSELSFISQYKEKWMQTSVQNQVEKKENEKKDQKQSSQILDEKILYLIKQISGLELLISFEKSEMYCEDKLKEKLEEKIWKERKRKLIQDRNWFIAHLFSSCQV